MKSNVSLLVLLLAVGFVVCQEGEADVMAQCARDYLKDENNLCAPFQEAKQLLDSCDQTDIENLGNECFKAFRQYFLDNSISVDSSPEEINKAGEDCYKQMKENNDPLIVVVEECFSAAYGGGQEGPGEGTSEGSNEGTSEDTSEGSSEGTSEGSSEGTSEEQV